MLPEQDMIKILTGSEIEVNRLKYELETIGVYGFVTNDFQCGLIAGFGGGTPTTVELFIRKDDFSKSKEVFNQFANK